MSLVMEATAQRVDEVLKAVSLSGRPGLRLDLPKALE